jgi:hypothetical protein
MVFVYVLLSLLLYNMNFCVARYAFEATCASNAIRLGAQPLKPRFYAENHLDRRFLPQEGLHVLSPEVARFITSSQCKK